MNETVTEHVRDDQRRLCQLPVIGKRQLDQIVRTGMAFFPEEDAVKKIGLMDRILSTWISFSLLFLFIFHKDLASIHFLFITLLQTKGGEVGME